MPRPGETNLYCRFNYIVFHPFIFDVSRQIHLYIGICWLFSGHLATIAIHVLVGHDIRIHGGPGVVAMLVSYMVGVVGMTVTYMVGMCDTFFMGILVLFLAYFLGTFMAVLLGTFLMGS